MLRRSFFSRSGNVNGSVNDFIVSTPRNLGFVVVPEGTEMVVERLGRFSRLLKPGFSALMPFVDKVQYAFSVKEGSVSIPHQTAVTRDNVAVITDGVLFVKITDAYKAAYHIDGPVRNLTWLAQTTMRSEIGKLTLDKLFEERELLNHAIVATLAREAENWGCSCTRYELRDISVSEMVRQAMDLQAEADRRKRKAILESEGLAEARINSARGERLAQAELALASKFAAVAAAEAGAEALTKSTLAVTDSLERLAKTLESNPTAVRDAVTFRLAESYIEAFGNIAKSGNTMILAQPAGDPSQMVAQAMSVFKNLSPTTNSTASSALNATSSLAATQRASAATTAPIASSSSSSTTSSTSS